MLRVVSVFLLCLLSLAADAAENGRQFPGIIPTPRSCTTRNGQFRVTPRTTIILEENSERTQFVARQINEELAAWHVKPLAVVIAKDRPVPGSIFIGSPERKLGEGLLNEHKGRWTPAMNGEGYFLDVDARGVVILGASEQGRLYGVMTLLQLIRREGSGVAIGGIRIHDYPSHRIRGITDDVSRGQISTVANFKQIVRFLARYKINSYSPYLEDMFSFTRHPLIGKGRGALTVDEVKEIDAFARRYYVDMIPTFQTLGHWENVLFQPEYASYAEYPGGRTLNVSDERVYTLLEELIGELCSAFSSPSFNMAADETRDVGLGANKDRVAKLGLAAVLAGHYGRVADIIRRHGKKPMIYGDIILKNPEILGMIPKDFTVIDWNYDPLYSYESPDIFRSAGFPFIVSPAVRNYSGPFLDVYNSFENIQRFSKAGRDKGANGVLVSSWNDYGGEALRELNYYGYAWGAECAWRPEGADVERFNRAFFRDFFGSNDEELFRAIFALLASPSNHYSWFELWRHPMLPFMPPVPQKGHSANIMERMQSIKSTMPLVLSLLDQAGGKAGRNIENLDYLRFVAKLNLWFAEKVETQEEVKMMCALAASRPASDSVVQTIVSRCQRIRDDLAGLRRMFSELWLRTNKPEGLELLLARYDRQVWYWEEKIRQVRRGEFNANPEIESAWIYHPLQQPGNGDSVRVQHAYFRKTFSIPSGVRSATLQLIGDTYAKVWVNGRMLGEVLARRSNSLYAEQMRAKVFDLIPNVSDTTLAVTAEVWDYSSTGSAGVNLCGEVRGVDGSLKKILTDESWKVSSSVPAGWMEPSFRDSSWTNAVKKDYPYTILRPDFSQSVKSLIER